MYVGLIPTSEATSELNEICNDWLHLKKIWGSNIESPECNLQSN